VRKSSSPFSFPTDVCLKNKDLDFPPSFLPPPFSALDLYVSLFVWYKPFPQCRGRLLYLTFIFPFYLPPSGKISPASLRPVHVLYIDGVFSQLACTTILLPDTTSSFSVDPGRFWSDLLVKEIRVGLFLVTFEYSTMILFLCCRSSLDFCCSAFSAFPLRTDFFNESLVSNTASWRPLFQSNPFPFFCKGRIPPSPPFMSVTQGCN